jgi:hypothetical protein
MMLSSFSVAQQMTLNEDGFVTCYQAGPNAYLFDWDHVINTPTKTVYYFVIKDCKQAKYTKDIPQEDLRNLDEIKNQLPEPVQFSNSQISLGAHKFRTEKSAAEYIQKRPDLFRPDAPEVLSNMKFETGDSFAEDVIRTWSANELIRNRSCDQFIGTCDFYLCQEQKNPCGVDGYNLSYGYKYCSGSKFKLLNEMTSDLGRHWVTEVFNCLQRKSLEDSAELVESENKCDQIQKRAYNSHPDCYVQAGFCDLKSSDRGLIFKLIKKEIFSAQTLIQGIKIIKECAKNN